MRNRLLAFLVLLGAPVLAAAGTSPHVTIVYFADLHAQLEEHDELFWEHRPYELVRAGGLARLAAAVRQIRAAAPGSVLFVDGGDTFQGSAPAAWSQGAVLVPLLNALHLDVGLPGNWEVVYGSEVLRRRAAELHYPLIAANIYLAGKEQRLFPPYVIREINGVRLGILGYTDPDVPQRQPPSYSKGLRYAGPEVLPPLIAELRTQQHVDVVLLLTHIGLPKAVDLAARLQGVDFVLSADTHERTYKPIIRGNTWVVEPGAFGSFLGRLDFDWHQGQIRNRRWELLELRADRFPEDPAVAALVDKGLAPYRARMNRLLGWTDVPLLRYDVVHTSLDALLADAVREAAGTDLALMNGFRFAPPKAPGAITEADLWTWLPVNTPIRIGVVTGQQLRDFWEREFEHVFSPDPRKLFGGWLPRPSGMEVRFVADAPGGQRLRDLRIGGLPVRPEQTYTLASCEREGDPEDTLCRIPHVAHPQTLALDAHAAVRRYLARHGPVRCLAAPRVCAEDRPGVLRSQFLQETKIAPSPSTEAPLLRAVVHVNIADARRQVHGLKNIRNILKASNGRALIEVVAHGPGIALVLRRKTPAAEQVQELLQQGVRFVACRNTMQELGLQEADLLPGVQIVPSGAVEVLRRQQEGYGYFRP